MKYEVIKMTFDEYDKMIENFDEVKVTTFWPTVNQIDMFKAEPNKWLKFACYLLEKSEPPKTNAEKYSKKNLYKFVNNHLELY